MSRIHLLPLRSRHLVSDTYWTRLTLLGQSWGSVVLGWEACSQLLPDVWLDTMGYAFTYPLVRLFAPSMPIGAYVHYPTISTDMLNRVRDRQAGHTNDAAVSSSAAKSTIKLVYYRLFAAVYAWSLRRADVLVANGSWTCNHLRQLLGRRSPEAQPQVVYPPCDTASLTGFPLVPRKRLTIVSLAQFRPEKEHGSQLRAVGLAIEKRPSLRKDLRLVCMGSCRNEADEKRIQDLKQLAKDLKIDDLVSFVVNAPYSTIVENLSQASIGISTMVDEHFGINVVEFMAAGLITLSHASAGPLLDIAVEVDGKPTGLHAHTLQDFAEAILKIADMDAAEDEAMRSRARRRAIETFSGAAFENAWQERLASRLMAPRKDKST
ncbi:hypothetical protein L7F22_022592 [Adiantum nelumboides]|nr:hypothetical protein [Adiantum nelumboides]